MMAARYALFLPLIVVAAAPGGGSRRPLVPDRVIVDPSEESSVSMVDDVNEMGSELSDVDDVDNLDITADQKYWNKCCRVAFDDPLAQLAYVVTEMQTRFKKKHFADTHLHYPVQRIVRDLILTARGENRSGMKNFKSEFFRFHKCGSAAIGVVALMDGGKPKHWQLLNSSVNWTNRLYTRSGVGAMKSIYTLRKFIKDGKDGYVVVQYMLQTIGKKNSEGHAFVVARSKGKVYLFQGWVAGKDVKFYLEYPDNGEFFRQFEKFLKEHIRLGDKPNKEEEDYDHVDELQQRVFGPTPREKLEKEKYEIFVRVSKRRSYNAEEMTNVLRVWEEVEATTGIENYKKGE